MLVILHSTAYGVKYVTQKRGENDNLSEYA